MVAPLERSTVQCLREEELIAKLAAQRNAIAASQPAPHTKELSEGVVVTVPNKDLPRPVRTSNGLAVTQLHQQVSPVIALVVTHSTVVEVGNRVSRHSTGRSGVCAA